MKTASRHSEKLLLTNSLKKGDLYYEQSQFESKRSKGTPKGRSKPRVNTLATVPLNSKRCMAMDLLRRSVVRQYSSNPSHKKTKQGLKQYRQLRAFLEEAREGRHA